MKYSLKFYLGILVFSILISVPLLIPYLHSGFFPTHDGEWAVIRLADMFREIKDLQIPPRFSGNLNFGFGYPLFNFAYPLPYYLGLLVHILGIGYVNSIKLLFAISIPVSAFFMFLASRSIWKNDFAGLISSVLYLYFPYRLVDLYVRGSIGESLAFAIFPMILLVLSKLVDYPKSSSLKLIGGILFGCLVLAHNIMAVLFLITLVIFFTANFINKRKIIIRPFASVIGLGMILSAFFWIPALLEKHFILLSKVPISDRSLYFVSLKDLLFSKWGYGIPTDPVNGFTYQIGWPFIAVMILVGIVLGYTFYKNRKISNQQIIATVLFFGILVFGLLMFRPFAPFWKLPLLSEINYPWTILSQLGLLISLLAGFLVYYQITKYLLISFSMLALILYIPLAKPSEYVDRGEGFYFTNDGTTTSSSELMPLWVKSFPVQRSAEKVLILQGKGNIENLTYNSKSLNFNTNLVKTSVIRINTVYYPGWNIYVDGLPVDINYSNQTGLMDFSVSKGLHDVRANFSETGIRMLADLISIFGILYMMLIIFKLIFLKFREYAVS